MFSWPGESRFGMVSLRLSCAVKPLAAHAATPSEPLPSGMNWVAEVLGRPSTTLARETIPPTFRANDPCCQAVVAAAGLAGLAGPMAAASAGARKTTAAAAARRDSFEGGGTIPP